MPDSVSSPAPTTDERSPIDFDVLSASVNGHPERMKKYAILFIDTAREEMQSLGNAVREGQRETLSRIGHKLKSSAKWVGALRFAEICRRLEKFPQESDLDEANESLDTLATEFVQIEAAVRARFGAPN